MASLGILMGCVLLGSRGSLVTIPLSTDLGSSLCLRLAILGSLDPGYFLPDPYDELLDGLLLFLVLARKLFILNIVLELVNAD